MIGRKRILLLAAIASCAAAGVVAAPPALASEYVYECSSCTHTNGPNQALINLNFAANNTENGVCSLLWRHNGGTSYGLVADVCTPNPQFEDYIEASSSSTIEGHGEVEDYYFFDAHLIGYQYLKLY